MSISNKCRAKDKGTCRVHGVNYMTGVIYNDLVKKGGFYGKVEDYREFIQIISDLIDNIDAPENMLEHPRDEASILYMLKLDSLYGRQDKRLNYLPVELIVSEVTYYKDPDKTKLPDKNLLEAPSEKSGYTGYEHALARFLAKEGMAKEKREDTYYGWVDFKATRHVYEECRIAAIEEVKEDYWREFNGTFNEDDDHVHGITGKGQCACGRFKGELRWSGSVTEAIKKILN